MWKLLKQIYRDDYGVILSTEIVIVGSVLVIGLMTGLTCLQQSVNGELKDVACALDHLDQSYSYTGHVGCNSRRGCRSCTAGSTFHDCDDACKEDGCIKTQHVTTSIGCVSGCTTGCDTGCSTGCGPVAAYGKCSTGCGPGFVGPVVGTGSRCVSTGVPGMRVTETPVAPVVISGPIPDPECVPCSQQTPVKKSSFNIPNSVW